MAEIGKKMGDYTPLESNKKEYFFGDGEGGVVAVGKTDAAGEKTNRLVKLSDVAGDKLPSGGTAGQVLTKTASGETWSAVPTELPSGGTAGQFLKKTDSGVEYASVSEVPSGGTAGQVLTKTASGNEWANAPTELPSSGTAGQFLKKTANGVEYASVNEVPSGGTAGQILTKTASGNEWADAPKELPATTSSDAGKALHVGSDGAPVFKFAELRQMPDVVQQSASDNGHIFTNNTYTKVILKYNLEQDLYSPEVKLASDELLNCIIDIYIDSNYSLVGHELFIMFDVLRNGESLKQIARPLTGDHFKHLEQGSYIRIYALGDSWSAQVGIPWNTPGWLPCQLVPPAEVGDKGKMLQVLDRDGNLGWGVGIPAPENSDVGKVLTASTSEGHLVAAWEEASGGGGGGGLTFGTPVTITNDMIYVDPETESKCVDINIVNNTYTEITLPSSVTEYCHVIRLNITTADVPNFVCHVKNQKNGSEPTVEVHYKTSPSSEDRELDFHSSMLPQHSDDIEHAPIIYSTSESELGLTGEAIVTCLGLFFDLRYLYSHVPPSGSWWGIHS